MPKGYLSDSRVKKTPVVRTDKNGQVWIKSKICEDEVIQDKQVQERRPKCETENCNNTAVGRQNNKWRCGECMRKYQEKLRKLRQQQFIQEEEWFK